MLVNSLKLNLLKFKYKVELTTYESNPQSDALTVRFRIVEELKFYQFNVEFVVFVPKE